MCFYLRNWQVTFLLYTLGVFISEYTAKAFTEPRDYRVVFLIQEPRSAFRQSRVLPILTLLRFTHKMRLTIHLIICFTNIQFYRRHILKSSASLLYLLFRLFPHLPQASVFRSIPPSYRCSAMSYGRLRY